MARCGGHRGKRAGGTCGPTRSKARCACVPGVNADGSVGTDVNKDDERRRVVMVSKSKLRELTLKIREANAGSECRTGHAGIDVTVPSAFRGGATTAVCRDCERSMAVPR